MTTNEATALDQRIKEAGDKLYIAYKSECCLIRTTLCWLESEWGDNSEEAANSDYYTREITATELNSLINEMLHGTLYRREIGFGLQDQLNQLVI